MDYNINQALNMDYIKNLKQGLTDLIIDTAKSNGQKVFNVGNIEYDGGHAQISDDLVIMKLRYKIINSIDHININLTIR